jgi:hypothetical protein
MQAKIVMFRVHGSTSERKGVQFTYGRDGRCYYATPWAAETRRNVYGPGDGITVLAVLRTVEVPEISARRAYALYEARIAYEETSRSLFGDSEFRTIPEPTAPEWFSRMRAANG